MDSTDSAIAPEQLQQMLAEKDQLIQALTGRLEGAAEQLDRIKRSGGDRGLRVPGGGGSAEFQEQQRTVLDSLSETVERWEEVQPREAFDRLEIRLDDLRSLMQSAINTGIGGGTSTINGTVAACSTAKNGAATTSDSSAPTEEGSQPQSEELSGWEAMKAQLMSGEDSAPASPPAPATTTPQVTPTDSPVPAAAAETTGQPVTTAVVHFTPTEVEDVASPEPVDFDTAEKSDLVTAVEVRDEYIGYLTRRLRSEEQRTRPTIDWEVLNNAPEDLETMIQGLEADLLERLRIAEVDLSLERAKLARIRANVEATQRTIEQSMKARGSGKSKSPAKPADQPPQSDEKPPKGWLNSLGLS